MNPSPCRSSEESTLKRPSRRAFIKDSSMIVAGSAVAGPLSLGAGVHSGGRDEMRIALIGCGQRGTNLAHQALRHSDRTQLVAMADVFADRLQASLRGLKGQHKNQVRIPRDQQFVGLDAFEQVLQTDADLIILATPPAFRPLHFEATVRASKHAFLERPVAVDSAGVRRVLQAGLEAQRRRLAVGVGLQHRYQRRYQQTIRRLHDGAIGEILLTRVYWNAEAPRTQTRRATQSELDYQLRNWRWFTWLGGDPIVERLIRNLDVINWLKQSYPVNAQGQGGRQVLVDLPGEIFDHHMVEFTYEDGSKLFGQCRQIPRTWNCVSEFAHGTHGTADIGGAVIRDAQGKLVWSFGRDEPNKTDSGLPEFIQAIRGGHPRNEATEAAGSTLTAILGRMATRSGQFITWDQAVTSSETLAAVDQIRSLDDSPRHGEMFGSERFVRPQNPSDTA
jgi:predicted dehydrogenase